jgi:hypothetical protein
MQYASNLDFTPESCSLPADTVQATVLPAMTLQTAVMLQLVSS